MTEEEIKKIKVEISDRLYSIYGFSTAVKAITCRTIDEILEDYCIVSKSKARELRQIVTDNADSLDHGLIDGLSDWVEINLGSSLFEEEK